MNLKRFASLALSVLMAAQCFAVLPAGAAENTLLISPNPAAAQESGTVLYHKDAPESFAEGQKLWNSNTKTGTMLTFLADGTGEATRAVSFYNNQNENGMAEGETMTFILKDLALDTAAYGEMELTFRYIQMNNYINVDQADDFQVYASTDGGTTWSTKYATLKAQNIVAFGGNANKIAGRLYDVLSTDLTALVGEGKTINALKIRPYGDFGGMQYYTSVASITVNGYKTAAPDTAGEVEYITVDEDTLRQITVDYAYQVAMTPWYHDLGEDIKTYNDSGKTTYPENVTQRYKTGRLYRGPMYSRGPDSTLSMWQSVLEKDGKYVGGTSDETNEWTVIGWDCVNVPGSAWSQITTSKNYHTQLYMWYSDEVILLGELKNPTRTTKHQDVLAAFTDEQIYDAYAQLKQGDQMYGPGHNRMVTVPANVVYDANGKINPDLSTVAITEEAGTVQYLYLTPAGKIVTSEEKDVDAYLKSNPTYTYLYGSSMRVDRVLTFAGLRGANYLPLTLKEFREGRVEKQRITVTTDVTAANVVSSSFIVMPQSNYYIDSMTTTLTDNAGKVLYKNVKYGETHDHELTTYDAKLDEQLKTLAAGSYKITVDVASGPVTRVLGRAPTQRVFELDFTV